MSSQLLVNVLSSTIPAGAVGYPVLHGLRSNDQAVAPTLILPAAQSVVTVASADAENVYLSNPSGAPVTVTLRCERGLSNELDAEAITPFFQNTGTGAGGSGVASVSVTAPIVNTGTATNPNIGASVGSTAGTVCAGNDARLSDTRVLSANSTLGATGSFSSVFLTIPLATVSPVLPTTITANGKLRVYMFNTRGLSYITNNNAGAVSVNFNIGGIGLTSSTGYWKIIVPPNTKAVIPDWSFFAISAGLPVTVSAVSLEMTASLLGAGTLSGIQYEISQFSGLQVFQ